jgi:hypothetical protein
LTVDGTTLSSLAIGSKILVKDQIDNTENGVYTKSVSGFAITLPQLFFMVQFASSDLCIPSSEYV